MELFEHNYFYFLLLALSISFPLLRSFEDKLSYYKKWSALFQAIFIMMLVHIPIDIVFTNNGHSHLKNKRNMQKI